MDKLYYNGIIHTMADQIKHAQALLVRRDRIIYMGDYAEAVRNASDQVEYIDLDGKTLMPGFIDAHGHFSSVANSFLQIPLDECTGFDEIEDRIIAAVKTRELESDGWLIAKGYDHNILKEHRHPDITFVDRIAPDIPMVLQHKSGHMGVFNSKALSLLGVTTETPAPSGGEIGSKDGYLTGYMEENAFIYYLKKVPLSSLEDMVTAYEKAQEKYASYGITTVQEGMIIDQLVPMYQSLLQSGILKLDVIGYVDAAKDENVREAFAEHSQNYKDHFRLGGYKIFLDGSPQGRTAWMRTPYKGDVDYYGYNTLEDKQVEAFVRKAIKENMQLLAHCNGDAACEQYIRAIQEVQNSESEMFERLRPVMIHAQLLDVDQLKAVKELGVIPSFFVAHIYHWGDIHVRNFGLERASRISPVASAHRKGILYTFHQDAPVIEPDMLETIWCAVNRKTKDGISLGEEECIDVYSALKAVTINSAYQYFEENLKGRLLPGFKADLVILDKNPLDVPKEELYQIKVLETIKDGETIYRR